MALTWATGWVAIVALSLAQQAPDLPSKAMHNFPFVMNNLKAQAASKAFQAGRMSQAADLAKRALSVDDLPKQERSALHFLYALASVRAGDRTTAIDAFRKCINGEGPAEIVHHANWYYGKMLLDSGRVVSIKQREEARQSLVRVPPLGRFGLRARTLLVNNLLASGQLSQAHRLAEMAVEHYLDTKREAGALLLLARCQQRLGEQIARTQGRKQAYKTRQEAATLFQEVAIVWPYLKSGISAKSYLLQLKRQGVYPQAADPRQWADRAIRTVTKRQRRKDLSVLRKIQSLFPKSATDSSRLLFELLYAELAARYRMFFYAQRSARRVLSRCKEKSICARAGFLLSGLVARTRVRRAIQAYQWVEESWPEPAYGPLALYKGGEIARRHGKTDSAREMFQRCVDTYPNSPTAAYCRWGLAWISFQSKRYDQALQWLDDLIANHPDQDEPDGILDLTGGFLGEQEYWTENSQDENEWAEEELLEKNEPVVLELPYRFSRRLERRRFGERVQYWRARALQEMSHFGQAFSIYRQLVVQHPYDYYSLMAWENLAALGAHINVSKKPNQPCQSLPVFPDQSEMSINHPDVLAADIYLRMGLEKETRTTLKAVEAEYLGAADRRIASLIWLALGEYGRSHRMASIPWEGGLPGFLTTGESTDACLAYPRAFGEVVEGSFKHPDVAADLIFALMRAESGFKQNACSAAQALGLTQVIRKTAYRTARKLKLRRFRFWKLVRPETAVQVGSAYLSELMKLFEGNLVLALAAYNAGEKTVQRWMARRGELRLDEFIEEIPYTETNRYVKKLLSFYAIYKALYQQSSAQPLGVNLASVPGSSVFQAKQTAWVTNQGK